jgi:hypothetical protein
MQRFCLYNVEHGDCAQEKIAQINDRWLGKKINWQMKVGL